jgi:hypothetical protein
MINKQKFIREYMKRLWELVSVLLVMLLTLILFFGPLVIYGLYGSSLGFIIYPIAILVYIGKLAYEESRDYVE